eukprot:GFUD01036807.1.p1 GENE.GFUD01036807.1~~GFUD01036807.1.p1  ORF type:complete len:552 (+),score=114.11 GFUD01036807.1:151-1806(+)
MQNIMDAIDRHRSPQTLLRSAQTQVVKIVHEGVTSLREKGSGWCLKYFSSREPLALRRHAMKTIQDYLASASHMFQDLAMELHRKDTACIEVILHPLLRTLEVTSQTLLLTLDQGHNLAGLTVLYLFFDIKRQSGIEGQLLNFVGSLRQLTKLKISNCCTDQLLAVLATSCPQLRVFDAEEDSEMSITDHGLAFLSNCRQLVSVVLNDDGDEYDYEDRYFGVSGKGIAHLIITLPKLTLLVCEPYLMREAIKFLYPINVNSVSYSLLYLHARFPSRDFLLTVSAMCPHIAELRLEDPSKDVAQALDKMSSLQKLVMTNYSWVSQDDLFYQPAFERLKTLVLKNPKMSGINIDFLKKVGLWCKNLTNFTLTLYYRDLITSSIKIKNRSEFFPSLRSLTIEGDASLCLMETLISSITDLQSLSIFVHSFSVPSGQFDAMILNMVKAGNLSRLRTLQCFQWEVSLDTMLYLIDQTPGLATIWGLDLLMMSPAGVKTIQDHIRKNNLNIDVHDGISPDPPKGLNFLSERSQHRVESSDHTAQADLESILVELNLI